MALSPGTWLNHYEVLGHLGTGGMGEVYRARDNKLQREVALKVLPKAFAQDPERVARFRREAQVLAQLNHPNIAAIYSFEEKWITEGGWQWVPVPASAQSDSPVLAGIEGMKGRP